MNKRLTEEDLLNELFEFEKSEAAIIEKLGPGKWDLMPAWNPPKDGKISRPMFWRPSLESWERQCIEMHRLQAEQAQKFNEEQEARAHRERQAERERRRMPQEESVSGNAQGNQPKGNESSSPRQDGFDFDVVVI